MSETISLISLPADVYLHLLHALPNLYTLQSVILTHSSLYSTYLTYRTQILKSVFLNQIHAPEEILRKDKPSCSRRGSLDCKVVDIIIPALNDDTRSSGSATESAGQNGRRKPRSIFDRAFGMIPISATSTKDTQAWENRRNQLFNQFPGLRKPMYEHPDSEIFLSAVWSIMPDKPTGSAVGSVQALRWGHDLICSYFYNDKPLEALKIASQIRDSTFKSGAPFKSLGAIRIVVYPRTAQKPALLRNQLEHECISFLIAIYRVLQMNEEAIELQKEVLSRVNPRKELHSSYSLGLSQTYKSLGPSYLPKLITFQTETWELYSQVYNPSHAITRDWSRYVLLTYTSNSMIQESLDFRLRALNSLTPGTMDYISWSRGLINDLKKSPSLTPSTSSQTFTNPEDAILTLTALTFSTYTVTSPGYLGWSRDLCQLLRAKNREGEALEVEIRVWEEKKRLADSRPRDKAAKFRARNPGLILAASYRRLGREVEARDVERACGEGAGLTRYGGG